MASKGEIDIFTEKQTNSNKTPPQITELVSTHTDTTFSRTESRCDRRQIFASDHWHWLAEWSGRGKEGGGR